MFESRTLQLLLLLEECLSIAAEEGAANPIDIVVGIPEPKWLEGGIGIKEVLNGGRSPGNGLNEKG